jgi:hypothetical protein
MIMNAYKYSPPISHDDAERVFTSGTPLQICETLAAIALNDDDWKWSQTQCLHFLNYGDPNVRGLAATCLGHIARIHHKLDTEIIIPALEEQLFDPIVGGQVSDALDDIRMFIQ